jgi:hypothetical protein
MADAWYFFDGAKQLGPLSLVELKRLLDIQSSPMARVWHDGLADWTRPAELPEFETARPSPLPPPLPSDEIQGHRTRDQSSSIGKTHRFNNFVARNWRGEFSLATTYWLFGFLANLIAGAAAVGIVTAFQQAEGFRPVIIFASILSVWLVITSVGFWQSVGVWRSAKRHISARELLGKSSPWAILAKVAVVLGLFRLIGVFLVSGAPQLVEAGRMAFLDDPDIPNYSMRVMRNGTEAEIAGGFKYGLTNDFEKILSASPQIRVVHLDSVGGRIGEAISLNKIIRDRGLDTYVSSNCMSACTVAFAGGRHRFLRTGATLGFHAPIFPGMTKEDLAESTEDQREIFLAAGFNAKFVNRALSTPNETLWTPDSADLLQAGVITAMSDGSDFAISGMGASVSKSDLEEQLSEVLPLMEPLKQRFPKDYESVVQTFFDSYVDGQTESEAVLAGRTALHAVLKRLKPLADDAVLVDIGIVYADEYSALGAKSAAQCYQFASGAGTNSALPDLPDDLVARENDVNKRVIETATIRPSADEADLVPVWEKIGTALADKGISKDQFDVFSATTVPASRYGDYCLVATMMLKEIGKLPRSEAAAVMREILAEK